jgi:hypothetical protein
VASGSSLTLLAVYSVVRWGRRHSSAVEEQIRWMGLGLVCNSGE